jgi:hypothetical protein
VRLPKKKASARVTALALALGVTAVLVTALPASAATITSFAPTCGIVGTSVTITGTGFNSGGAATAVRFNGTNQPTFTVVSDTSITTTVPAAATSGTIAVDAPTGNTVSTTSYIVAAAGVPTITSFAPLTGSVGSSVIITGTNFGCTTSVVFNVTGASYVVNSATQITATVPAGTTAGPLHVTTTGGGPATSAASFTATATPTITSFSPTSGNVGTSVTVIGTNLLGVTSVKFNGTTATFTTSTATSVSAVVPTGATTGRITVTTPGGIATSLTDFTVTTAPIARSVTFGFDPNSRVSGQVNVTNGLSACSSQVKVVIQKQHGGSFKWADTTATTKTGSFKTYIPPSHGNFRAKINQVTLVNGVVCGGDTSNTLHT